MTTHITKKKTPEEHELERKEAELRTLEATLADRELEYATLQAELAAFSFQYARRVGVLYAKLDELNAQLAEERAKKKPRDERLQREAAEAKAQAKESAQAVSDSGEDGRKAAFTPSEDLKQLFREVAKAVHPDLAGDDEERERRHRFMAAANRAYQSGDKAKLEAILHEWQTSPEAVKGAGPGAELVRTIRKIAAVRDRLSVLETEIDAMRGSDVFKLKIRVDEAAASGVDLLGEMAEAVNREIAQARKLLSSVAVAPKR
jgi:hypothetical protein